MVDPAWHPPFNTRGIALMPQQVDDLLRTAIAEQLPQFLFMITNPMLFNERDKVLRAETRQCGLAKMRVVGNEIFCPGVAVCKIASPAAGYANFFGKLARVIQQ